MRATWIGHATVLAEVDGDVILCDPIFSDRCFPFQWIGPKRYRRPACTVDQVSRVDAITVVPGFRVLGFSVLPGFRALKASDGAWSVHKTLFGFSAPVFQQKK